jgi:hypothetical protein
MPEIDGMFVPARVYLPGYICSSSSTFRFHSFAASTSPLNARSTNASATRFRFSEPRPAHQIIERTRIIEAVGLAEHRILFEDVPVLVGIRLISRSVAHRICFWSPKGRHSSGAYGPQKLQRLFSFRRQTSVTTLMSVVLCSPKM